MMSDYLKFRRSAGVPVSAAVHAILKQANAARDQGDPETAATLFRKALDRDPSLAHIWVQYGHMLRAMASHAAAEEAYRTALHHVPGSDPHVHLGHLYKETGRLADAARSYIDAVRADPRNADALAEIRMLVARGVDIRPQDIIAATEGLPDDGSHDEDPVARATNEARTALSSLTAALKQANGDDRHDLLTRATTLLETLQATDRQAPQDRGGEGIDPVIVFDVSDLLSYFNAARLPTGIQRVQIEVIRHAMKTGSTPPRVCSFLDTREEWVEVPATVFLPLCRLAVSGNDLNAPDWLAALTRLHLTLTMAESFAFPHGAFLINLGTSWWLQNYFLAVREAKASAGIRYVPFVHDLIPIMAGEHCTPELTRDFISWAMGAFDHADAFFANSEATKRDLLTVSSIFGKTVSEDDIVVIRLDADFRKPVDVPARASKLDHWGIGRSGFVLFVSTIESRKNHIGAFDAWISLLRDHGARRIPKLVCVGNKGWLNDTVYARLAAHDDLRERVVMLSGLTDAELALLYRNCLFTLYPSNYEGWGLPVTESLCYGKVPLASNASSLPEAGGPFALFFDAGSTASLTAALHRLIFDTDFRTECETRIVRDFAPRSWSDIATQLSGALGSWSARTGGATIAHRPPTAMMGAYHPIVRNFATRIWPGMRSGEIFRTGSGWWGPDDWGCWTKSGGGTLAIGLPNAVEEGVRLHLQIHGLPDRECRCDVTLSNGQCRSSTLNAGAFKWMSFDIDAPPADRCLRLTVEGMTTADLSSLTKGLDPRIISVGVAGFFLCAKSDIDARTRFLEAVALGTLDTLAFDREPCPAP